MKGSASLLGLTVGDYFNSCNWQLSPPKKNNNLPKQAKKVVSPQRPSVLAALSVKEFFNSCNWQLLSQPLELDEEITSSLPPDLPSNLPCLTVTEFLSLCNWQLLPPEVRLSQSLPVESTSAPTSASASTSPLTMQVQAFFPKIPWGGSHQIGESPQTSNLPKLNFPAPGEMNANDLSKLF